MKPCIGPHLTACARKNGYARNDEYCFYLLHHAKAVGKRNHNLKWINYSEHFINEYYKQVTANGNKNILKINDIRASAWLFVTEYECYKKC